MKEQQQHPANAQGAIISGGSCQWVSGDHPDADLVVTAEDTQSVSDIAALRDDIRAKLNADAPTAASLSRLAPALTWLQRLGRGEVRYTPSRKETAPDGR